MQKLDIVGGKRAGTQGSFVFRWDLEGQSIPEQFFGLATAYLESAVAQFGRMLQQPQSSYYDALVGDFLAEHALELFFKGAILSAANDFSATHPLDQLYGRYRNLYAAKRFQFAGPVDEFVVKHPERPNSVYPRYPIDTDGKSWEVVEHFIVEIWHDELSVLLEDFKRLIPLIEGK
jgi:hypothetical protein